jgi:AcrR family transcriptional regulator
MDRGYANGRATREEVLRRAAEVFAESGYHGASLRAIARNAGIDHSTLLHHFGNKTDLLLSVLRWRDEEVRTIMWKEHEDIDSFRKDVTDVVRHNQSVPGLVQLYSVMSAEAASDEAHPARHFFQQRSEHYVELYEKEVRRLRQGTPPPDLNEQIRVFYALWEGLQVYDALNPGKINIERVLDMELQRLFEC